MHVQRHPFLTGVVAGLVFCSALAATVFWSPSLTTGSGRLEIREDTKSLGDILPGSEHVAEFQFQNTGTSRVKILDIKTSCGCLQPKLNRTILGPGETAAMEVRVVAPHNAEHISHSIILYSSAPGQSLVRLQVFADVRWPIEVSDEAIQFHSIRQGDNARREIELFTPDASSFDVARIETTVPWLNVDVVIKSFHRQRFAVSVQPPSLGHFAESIRFHTTVRKRLMLTVPVTGEVRAASIVVEPRLLLLGNVAPSEARNATVKLVAPSGLCGDFAVSSVRFASREVKGGTWTILEWLADRLSGASVVVNMRLRAPDREGYHRTQLALEIGKPPAQVSIPVSCLVVGPESADGSKR